MTNFLHIIDIILFIIILLGSIYIIVFIIAHFFKTTNIASNKTGKKYLVLFPAYNEDKTILNTIKSFLKQDYPSELYKVLVISDHMREETNKKLKELGASIVIANYKDSSKAKALQLAADYISTSTPQNPVQDKFSLFDGVIILDADNTVDFNFLTIIDHYFDHGRFIQVHRTSKNRNTSTAVLDAASEEINNAIFRKGHVNLGLSSALIGSGMIFDYKWFIENVYNLKTAGEDKEFEILLLKNRLKIEYINHILVYDEKTQKSSNFYKQRQRWISAQISSFSLVFKNILPAVLHGNFDYADKLFQWLLLPRIMYPGLIVIFGVIAYIINPYYAIKWLILFFIVIFMFILALPKKHRDYKLLKSIATLPLLFLMIGINLFKTKRNNYKFIHTEKDYENRD